MRRWQFLHPVPGQHLQSMSGEGGRGIYPLQGPLSQKPPLQIKREQQLSFCKWNFKHFFLKLINVWKVIIFLRKYENAELSIRAPPIHTLTVSLSHIQTHHNTPSFFHFSGRARVLIRTQTREPVEGLSSLCLPQSSDFFFYLLPFVTFEFGLYLQMVLSREHDQNLGFCIQGKARWDSLCCLSH